MPPTPPVADTRGFIDVIRPEGDSVILAGWALPREAEPVDRFTVAFGGEKHAPLPAAAPAYWRMTIEEPRSRSRGMRSR